MSKKKGEKPQASESVREYLAEIGRKGGKTKSPARTEAARAAARARWAKYKSAKVKKPPTA
jgi:general stress protein YciG